MIAYMDFTDEALATHDRDLYQLMSQAYADLYKKQLPYIHNHQLRAMWIQARAANLHFEEQAKRGIFDYQAINQFFKGAVNGLNDFLNSHRRA